MTKVSWPIVAVIIALVAAVTIVSVFVPESGIIGSFMQLLGLGVVAVFSKNTSDDNAKLDKRIKELEAENERLNVLILTSNGGANARD